MSSKRMLKKQQKRQESALAQLEELYRRGADDELLTRVADQLPDLASSPFAARWAEAADRALRQSLARADLGRLDRLLRSLPRSGRPRPLAPLAEAVLDLAAGRPEAARSRLAVLAGAEDGLCPSGLLAALQALVGDEADGGSWSSRNGNDPYLHAAGELFQALRGVASGGFALTALDRKTLALCLEAVRTAAPVEDGGPDALNRLLDSADRCLSLLTDLAALETKLNRLRDRGKEESQASEAVAVWLRGAGPFLMGTLSMSSTSGAVPPLLSPLHQAVQRQWRAVLERVAALEGPPGLAALCLADPKLLEGFVDVPGGVPGNLAGFRQRVQARQLLDAGQYKELASLLRARSRAAAENGASLAVLWSLELWARSRQTESRKDDLAKDFPPADRPEPIPHRTLVRLEEMAGEVGRRFPAGQRAAVARMLRDDLFILCEEVNFCEHTAGAALALLEHQAGGLGDGGDLGLLIAGVVGAISGDAPRLFRSLETRIERLAPAPARDLGDLEIARRLMTEAAREQPRVLARSLDVLKPLFAQEIWPEITALVAQEMSKGFAEALGVLSLVAMTSPEIRKLALEGARDDLELLRPSLAGTLGFAAAELVFDCWRPDRAAAEKRLAKFLAAHPGGESALAAFLVLDEALKPWSPAGVEAVLRGLAQAAIASLDDRWRLWCPAVPRLALAADPSLLPGLARKIEKILAGPESQGENRALLEHALQAVHAIRTMRRSMDRSQGRREPRRKKPRRKRATLFQPSLDLQ